jgi:cell division transport system permease protein
MALNVDYVLRETGGNLFRNPGVTLATVLTVTVSLGLVAVAMIVGFAVSNATERWEGGIEFVVFMQADATDEQIAAVQSDLADNPAVDQATYIDKDQAFEEFRVLFSDTPDFTDNIDREILPTSFRVRPVETDADLVADLGQQYEAKAGVLRVVFATEAIRSVQSLASNIINLIVWFAGALVISATVLIVTTIQMAASSRRREIEVMKLVGATNWFIRVPFMLEGLVQGLFGGLLASVLAWRFAPFFEDLFRDEALLLSGLIVTGSEMTLVYLVVLSGGTLLGALAAGIAVTWFMDV